MCKILDYHKVLKFKVQSMEEISRHPELRKVRPQVVTMKALHKATMMFIQRLCIIVSTKLTTTKVDLIQIDPDLKQAERKDSQGMMKQISLL